jgi:hypothetical protein
MRQPTLGRLDWIKEEFQQKKTKTKSSKWKKYVKSVNYL